MTENKVDTVVSTAYMSLSPKLQEAYNKHNCFITIAREESRMPITIDGVLKIPEPVCYVMMDMTRGPADSLEEFLEHTKALYRTFMKIEEWHRC